jgi:hypothetical protein
MEYEIDDEAWLFDDSTNPSLESPQERAPTRGERRKPPQRAELIPEEEEQPA